MRTLAIFILLVVATCITGCKKENFADPSGVCGVKDPLSNLSWLKLKISELKADGLNGQVRRFRYHGQDIISIQAYIQSCYPCNLHTCSGRVLTYEDDEDVWRAVMNNLDGLETIGEF